MPSPSERGQMGRQIGRLGRSAVTQTAALEIDPPSHRSRLTPNLTPNGARIASASRQPGVLSTLIAATSALLAAGVVRLPWDRSPWRPVPPPPPPNGPGQTRADLDTRARMVRMPTLLGIGWSRGVAPCTATPIPNSQFSISVGGLTHE
jgi:hypothetical protein